MKAVIYIFSLIGILVLASCQKDNDIVDINPKITLKDIYPTTIKEFQDSIIIVLEYTDGDGDLGFVEADSLSLRVHDSRLQNPDWYHIAPLSPVGEKLSIQGTIKLKLNSTFLLGNGGQETTTLSFYLKDRANHWSNEAVSPVITIVP